MMERRCYVLLRRSYDVHWDVQRDVAATSPQRLNAGWVINKTDFKETLK